MSDRDDMVERFFRLDTVTLSEELDRYCIAAGQCLNIKPLEPGFSLNGRAYTLQYVPAGKPAGICFLAVSCIGPSAKHAHLMIESSLYLAFPRRSQ